MYKKALIASVLLVMSCSSIVFSQETISNGPKIRDLSVTNTKLLKKSLVTNVESGKIQINKSLQARNYTLGPNDILNISVLGSVDLTQSGIRVQPDGRINIMYLEDLNVTGMTIIKLQDVIKDRYSDYLINPNISITLSQSRPFIVYLAGAIYNPGSYELNTITNSSSIYSKPEAFIERKTPLLSNVIIAAGGLSYDADLEHVLIKNDVDGSNFELNLFDLIENANSAQDIYLMAGDKIFIPRLVTPFAIDQKKYKLLARSTFFQKQIPVRVIGDVNNPGLFKLDSSDSGSLNSAIALAGGYASGASYVPKRVYISRLDNNSKLVTQFVDPRKDDIALMPNDIIYVPEKFRPIIGKGLDYMVRILAPFNAFSNVYSTWDGMGTRN